MAKSFFLVIDTEARRFGLVSSNKPSDIAWSKPLKKEERFSEGVKSLLSRKKVSVSNLSGAMVIQGKGSFSDTRAGVHVANILGHENKLPLISVASLAEAQTVLASDFDQKMIPLVANYYAEPNITR